MTLALKVNQVALDAGVSDADFFKDLSFSIGNYSIAQLGIITEEEYTEWASISDWSDQAVMGTLEAILRFVNQAEDLENEERAAGERLSSVSVQEGTSIQSDANGFYRTVTYTVRFRQPVDMQPVGPVLG